MKRIAAFVLMLVMLAMLFPADVTVLAEGVTEKPFYTLNWGAPEGDCNYIYYIPNTWVNESKITESTDAYSVNVLFECYGTSDLKTAAQKMYEDFSNRPAGTRYFSFAAQRTLFEARCEDLIDMTHGVELTKNWLDAFLAEFKSLGGELDGIAIDLEYNDASTHYINAYYYAKGDTEIYNKIAANEFYKTEIRPLLVERGFIFYTNPDPEEHPERSELWTLYPSDASGGNATSRSIWNQVVQELLSNNITEATYEPLIKYFPDAVLSDYKTGDSYGWLKGMSHTGSQSSYTTSKAGNASNYNFYDYATGYIFYGYKSESDRSQRTLYQKPASYNNAVFADAPYSRTNWEVNTFKRLLASTDTGKVNAWITFFNYGTYGPGYTGTPYYSELIYHLGMADPEPFLGYILKRDVLSRGEDDPDPNVCEYEYSLKIVDELMAELTRVAGYSDRKAIVTPITWNYGFFYSGMYAGGRNIWRLSPDTQIVSKEDFLVDEAVPTFRAGDVTITFPEGKIITDSTITHVGTCGYWIETPADVEPVITSTAERYENAPSFGDTFDSYAIGTFTSDSVLPNTYWTVTGTASIEENGNGKALALSGDAAITNTKVPELITAGDYYAKQQAWEVTVTLPSGGYGEVKLLSCASGDGGIKLSDGKVYYDRAGTYQELSGVSLSAGTYTVRREVDFRAAGGYACSYSIYDSTGNCLGSVENVAMAAVTVPVTTVSIATAGAANAVLIDDYKLYPIGVTANLELYDAALGRALTDTTVIRTEDTAYRLSWMNASAEPTIAKVYNGTTLVETIEMAPGMDGVATGIVEANGGTVSLSVKVEQKTLPNEGDTDSTETPTGGSSDNGNTQESTGNIPAPDPKPNEKGGMGAGVTVLIAVVCLLVLCGGAVAVLWFAVRPKLTPESPAALRHAVAALEAVFLKKSPDQALKDNE